ncbi:Hypothetical protein, putative [Bodo saltans]|uniref:Uncharacterized protein n=1 Tax=Bodo saltans TaxID=75058 RepID=A0A0S4IZ81_BODSA|nr:Hypothetical protein, putative [Bodo saltans]|eukprot:CUG28856.1 Hypothetical protein, putative [Bodo saltans]
MLQVDTLVCFLSFSKSNSRASTRPTLNTKILVRQWALIVPHALTPTPRQVVAVSPEHEKIHSPHEARLPRRREVKGKRQESRQMWDLVAAA